MAEVRIPAFNSTRLEAFDEAIAELASHREFGAFDFFVMSYEDIKVNFADLLENKNPHDIVWGKLNPEDVGDPLIKFAAECVAMRLVNADLEKVWDIAKYLGLEGYDRVTWCKFVNEKKLLLPREEMAA